MKKKIETIDGINHQKADKHILIDLNFQLRNIRPTMRPNEYINIILTKSKDKEWKPNTANTFDRIGKKSSRYDQKIICTYIGDVRICFTLVKVMHTTKQQTLDQAIYQL